MTDVTRLLESMRDGDADAPLALYAHLYPEIKRVARARLSQVGGVDGLNPTALVNEGFLRIADLERLQGRTRGEFFAYVGRVLRSVVIDHLRAESADKRSSGGMLLTLSGADDEAAVLSTAVDLIAIDRALRDMQRLDPGLYGLLEMLHFAGTSVGEVAEIRGVSRRTVERDVIKARLLLNELLGEQADHRPV
jgi:RNA polymerase sigma factor (TIGR02999 family)